MKSFSYLLVSVVTIFCMSSCSGEEKNGSYDKKTAGEQMAAGDHKVHSNMDMGSSEPSGESIYNVSSRWKTRHGNTIKLDSLRGNVQVMAMVYTHCEYACPRILADMKRIQDALSKQALARTRFTVVSIDPERDTPKRLRTFANENNLSEEQWTLLNGSQGDILELAALLGVKYKSISETDFTHSNMITVLNQEGEVAYQRNKLADKATEAIDSIEKLAAGR